jgi:hypothetical protein
MRQNLYCATAVTGAAIGVAVVTACTGAVAAAVAAADKVDCIALTVSAATPAICNAFDVAVNTAAALVGALSVAGCTVLTNDINAGMSCSAASIAMMISAKVMICSLLN